MGDYTGESSAGTWTLIVADEASGKVKPGTLQSWSLQLRSTVPYNCNPRTCGDPVPLPVGATLQVAKSGPDAALSWNGVSGAADYHVWRDGSPDFVSSVFAGESGGTTTFNDVGAMSAPGVLYYLVKAVNSCNWESD